MLCISRLVSNSAVFVLMLFAVPVLAQTTHVVMVGDNFFDPAEITIQAGDTVRWENPPGGNFHNVLAEDFSFSSGSTQSSFTFEHEFTTGGAHPYYCQPHRLGGMTGVINVEGDIVVETMDIDPGHSGNWWKGADRSGEGAQIEVADGGGGEQVFVATMYSYGPDGGQIFLVAVGTPDGDTVEVNVFITEGGMWGDGFDPANVSETQWGTGVFTAIDCATMSMTLTPNAESMALGYTELSYELVRVTTPEIACPYEG